MKTILTVHQLLLLSSTENMILSSSSVQSLLLYRIKIKKIIIPGWNRNKIFIMENHSFGDCIRKVILERKWK